MDLAWIVMVSTGRHEDYMSVAFAVCRSVEGAEKLTATLNAKLVEKRIHRDQYDEDETFIMPKYDAREVIMKELGIKMKCDSDGCLAWFCQEGTPLV